MALQSARALALTALRDWRDGRNFADAILQDLLNRSTLAGSDRGFATELFYGVLRNLTLLDFWISLLRSGKVDLETRDLLRLGLYQIVHLKTPAHAAVFETVALASPRSRGVVNGVLRSADRRLVELKERATQQPLHVRSSHPEFLVAKWTQQFGSENTARLCEWNNWPAPVYARINELKTTAAELIAANPGAMLLPNDSRFAEVPDVPAALAVGTCYVQDPSTALACDLLAPNETDSVLDACAAPGGKTSFVAQLMRNRGQIVACDRASARLNLLRTNLDRLGVTNTRVLQHDWLRDEPPPELAELCFDRILIDVPCSNTGVMRRRIDVRWRLRPEDFTRLPNEQFAIVRQVLPLLRPGGVLVYSTCSIDPEENDQVAARLTSEFSSLELVTTKAVLPFRDGFDGAFAARFVCK